MDFKTVDGFDANAWLPYKETQATTGDGKIIGLGTDAGPTAICYNKDAFQKAGLPTDRDTLAAQWNGSWEKFIELGKTLGKPLVMRLNLNQQSNGPAWTWHKNLIDSLIPIVDCGVHYVDVMCQLTDAKPVRVHGIGAKLWAEADKQN